MRVLVSVPNTGPIHKHVTVALLKLQADSRYALRVILPTHSPYENNLHHILNDFMEGREDYWLNIDSDNPPFNNPLDLVSLDLDIVGLPTPVWHFIGKEGERPIYWNAYQYVEESDAYTEWPVKEGLQEVDAIGTGCFLIARRVFENERMRKGPFLRKHNSDGTVERGNDIAFCERAILEGFQVWVHFDYPCMHFNELELNDVVRAFKGLGVR